VVLHQVAAAFASAAAGSVPRWSYTVTWAAVAAAGAAEVRGSTRSRTGSGAQAAGRAITSSVMQDTTPWRQRAIKPGGGGSCGIVAVLGKPQARRHAMRPCPTGRVHRDAQAGESSDTMLPP
jgi:hypothetical protein